MPGDFEVTPLKGAGTRTESARVFGSEGVLRMLMGSPGDRRGSEEDEEIEVGPE